MSDNFITLEVKQPPKGKEPHIRVNEGAQQPSQTDIIMDLVTRRCEAVHDANKDGFVIDKASGRVMSIDSSEFGDFVGSEMFKLTNKAMKPYSFADAAASLKASARFSGRQVIVNRRVACHEGNLYLDLCQEGNSKAACVSAQGACVVSNPPVLFLRSNSMQELPEPDFNGSFDLLWDHCNVPDSYKTLILGWLIDSLRSETPYLGLELIGEQGSGKSTTNKVLRSIIDPSAANTLFEPKDIDDLKVTAYGNHIVSYGNLSALSDFMQDALCHMSTGGGFGGRKLYTNLEASVVEIKRPWIVDGIEPLVTRMDTLDRTITVELPRIRERKSSVDQTKAFKEAHAAILGGILTLAAKAMAEVPSITIPPADRPRMIEFCELGMAVTRVLYNDDMLFLKQYKQMREDAILRLTDESPIVPVLVQLVREKGQIIEPTKEILRLLRGMPGVARSEMPRDARQLGSIMRRYNQALKVHGVECQSLGKIGGLVKWQLTRI